MTLVLILTLTSTLLMTHRLPQIVHSTALDAPGGHPKHAEFCLHTVLPLCETVGLGDVWAGLLVCMGRCKHGFVQAPPACVSIAFLTLAICVQGGGVTVQSVAVH